MGQWIMAYQHIGEVVRARREELKLKLGPVADRMTKYDAGNLSRFERGRQWISSDRLEEIATILETTVSKLYQTLEEQNEFSDAREAVFKSVGEASANPLIQAAKDEIDVLTRRPHRDDPDAQGPRSEKVSDTTSRGVRAGSANEKIESLPERLQFTAHRMLDELTSLASTLAFREAQRAHKLLEEREQKIEDELTKLPVSIPDALSKPRFLQ